MSVLGVIGGAIGFYLGGPAGASLGYSIGSGVDAVVNTPDRVGPRLEDLRVQLSQYGATIPFEWGTNRHAGTIIWPRILEAVEHEDEQSGGLSGPDNVTFRYTLSCAVLLCEGPIAGVRRIWANKKIVYDVSEGNTGPTQDPAVGSIRFYLGTEDQMMDPLIEATDGPGPAYRGYAYVVFENYDVTELNGRPPQWEFEVITEAGAALAGDASSLGEGGGAAAVDPNTGYIWSVKHVAPNVIVYITDNATQSLVNTIVVEPVNSAASMANSICYVDSTGQFWVANQNGTNVFIFNAAAQVLIGQADLYHSEHDCGAYQSPGLSWHGMVCYDKSSDLVLFATTNINTSIRAYSPRNFFLEEQDPCGAGAKYIAARYPKYMVAVPQYGLLSFTQVIVSSSGLTLAVANGHVFILRGESVLHDIEIGDIWSTAGGLTYDSERDRILLTRNGTNVVVAISASTRIVTEYSFDLPQGSPAEASSNFRHILYHAQTDSYLVTAHILGSKWTLLTIDPNSFAMSNLRIITGPRGTGTMIEVPGATSYFVHADLESGQVWRIPIGGSLSPSQASLGVIVADICKRAGLSDGDIDTAELTDSVDGYIVPRQMTARAAIEPLQQAFFFDAVESDDKIKFVKRGKSAATLIPIEDRAAHEHGQEVPDGLTITRAFELELPVQCDTEYPDIEADHLIGNQTDRRVTKDTRHNLNLQLPIVMKAEKAKSVARTLLYDAWQNQVFKFSTSRKYAHLEPTSLVELPTAAAMYRGRITGKREQPNGVIEWEAKVDSVDVYTQTGEGAALVQNPPQTVYEPGMTILELLDMPILRDADDNNGFYDAMGGTSTSWSGAQLLKSSDNGQSYAPVHSIGAESAIGVATTVLPDFTEGNIFDRGSTVTVRLRCGPALVSVTEEAILNGANMAAIGAHGRWEVIQFETATLAGPNTYVLSGLLRGRRGTEWATGQHAIGDHFVLASPTSWSRVVPGEIGLDRLYKAPPYRSSVAAASSLPFRNEGVGLKPFSPVDFSAQEDASGNVVMRWNRRTRLLAGPLNKAAPLGESLEAYEVDILDGSTVVRTLATSAPSVVYSVNQQIADFGAIQSEISFVVYQLSSVVGRGTGLSATTTTTSSGNVGEIMQVAGVSIDGLANYTYTDVTLTIPGHSLTVGQSLRLAGMENTQLWEVDMHGRSHLREIEFGVALNNTEPNRATYTIGSIAGDTVVLKEAVRVLFIGGDDSGNNSYYIIWGAYLIYPGGGMAFTAAHADGLSATIGSSPYGGGSTGGGSTGGGSTGGGSSGGGGTTPTPTPTPTYADHNKLSANTLVSNSAVIDRLEQ